MKNLIQSLALLAAALVLSACATKPNTQVLSKAFENQKYKVVEKQIEAGVDINAPADEAGNTVLQQAILRGDSKAFEYLVANSANPFVRNKNNQTAVDLALNSSSDYFISWAKAASQESNGSNAYKQAIQAINNNDAETLKTLLQGNAFYWYSMPLIGHKAVDVSCVDCLSVLKEVGYDFSKLENNLPITTSFVFNALRASNGSAPEALAHTQSTILQILLTAGADINAKDKGFWTPLFYAVDYGRKDLVALLLAKGADIHAADDAGWSAQHLLADSRESVKQQDSVQAEIARVLVKAGADLNAKTQKGLTALYLAVANNRPLTAKVLVEGGADAGIAQNNGMTPLMSAVNDGQLEMVKLLLSGSRIMIDAQKDTGWTALNFVANGDEDAKQQDAVQAEIARVLIKSGADLNAKTQTGYTPVHLAVVNNRPLTAKVLVEAGADANIAKNDGWTPLMSAVNDGQLEMVKILTGAHGLLINQQKNDGWAALHVVVNGSESVKQQDAVQAEIARVLVKAGADLNSKTQSGYTPVHLAVANNRPLTAKVLVEAGADINIAKNDSWTPLMEAIFGGNLEIVKLLLASSNLMINQQTGDGWTALHFTVNKSGVPEKNEELAAQMAQLLINKKANLNLRTQAGYTPLMLAVMNNRIKTMGILLRAKADPVLADSDGWTPLMRAVFDGNLEAATLLAQTKKGINTKGPLGWTALHFCANGLKNGTRTKDAQLVDLLIKNGAAIETKIQDGRTPLTLAVVYGRSEVVQALLKHKPNKQVVDNKGYTALDYALDNKNWAVAGLLQGISAREAYEESLYPVKPAARAGYTTCNTRCFNGDCYRTYADGRKEHFQAQQKYNPISGNWEYDSGTCN